MFKSHLARTILCLALVFVLVFNIYAMPTKASATGTLVTVGALTFITCALIGLGIHAGTTNDDFNSIASNCLSSLQGSGAISGDSVLGYLVDGKVHFLQSLIEAVHSWIFSEEVVSASGVSTYGCFVPANTAVVQCYYSSGSARSFSVGADCDVIRYYYLTQSGNHSFYLIFFNSFGGFSWDSTCSVNGVTYYYDVFAYTPGDSSLDIPMSKQGAFDNTDTSVGYGRLYGYSELIALYLSGVSFSSPYDISINDVAVDNEELSSHYTDWAAGAIPVPGTAIGGTSDEEEPMLPLGLGSTVEESLGMTQEEVWAGAGTYTGESAETEDGETNEGELNTDPVKWASLAALLSKISDFLTGRLDTLINLVTVVRDWCNDWWDKLGTTFPALIAEWWSSVWTHVDDSFDSVLIGIRDGISGVKQWVDTAWDDFVTTFPTAMSKWWEDVWTHVDDTFDSVLIGIRDGVAGIRSWANEWWDTLTITLPQTIAKWWEGVWTDARSIPDFLTAALENVITKILEGIRDIFVPSEDYLTEKLEAIKSKFAFADSIISTAEAIGAAISFPGSEPPVIYIHLEDAEGDYSYGGTVAILDMNWYARYKPTVDKILAAFLWLCFVWKIFKKAPGIISGMPDDVDFSTVHLPAVVNRSSSIRSSSTGLRRLR